MCTGKQILKLAVLLWLPALFLGPGNAQTTGTILGQISDPSGGAVVGATVRCKNISTGLVRSASTNTEGGYLLPSLPTGTYEVTAEASGFKLSTQTGISLEVAQNARIDFNLQVGSVNETVNVAAAAVAVDTQSTTIGAVVDNRRVSTIPLNGRNVLALAQLLPGVGTIAVDTAITFNRNGPRLNISGGRANENSILLDGSAMIGVFTNVGQNLPSPDTLQEFRILTNTYSAEYGRAAGGVFLAISKSGTNDLHGSAWEYLRNDTLNARNFFAASKPFLRQNQFGVSAGGPVVIPGYNGRNRTFVFGSYQGLRIRQQSLITNFPATALEREGDFSALGRPIQDPVTGQPFPRNIIPADRIDPLSRRMLSDYLLLPNQADGRSLTLRSLPTSGNQYAVKVDHKLRSSDDLSVRFYQNKDQALNQGGGDAELLSGTSSNLSRSWSVNETHIFSPGLLNEFRSSYTRSEGNRFSSPANKSPRELGGKFNQDGSLPLTPSVTVSGRYSISPVFPQHEPDNIIQVGDKVSWIRNRHSIKAGAEVIRLRHLTRAQFQSSGSFTFNGLFTGNAMADYMLGLPSALFHQSILEDDSRSGEYNFFAQDDFKVHRKLTLNFGLRYELRTPWVQRRDHTAVIRLGQQSKIFPTAPPGLVFPGDAGVPRGLIPTDKNNFAPRFGFAWDPVGNGRTSVRGAYGVFYSYAGAVISAVVNQTLPYVLPLSLPTPPSFSDPYRGRQDPFPYVVNPQNPIFIYPIQAYTISPDYRDGYVQQFNLNVQHQFGSNLVMQAGYVGSVGHKLLSVREANAARYVPGATAANVAQRRPIFPQFYDSISDLHSDTDSNYHSLQVSIDKRFSQGYTVQLAYTFSKSIDNRSGYTVDSGVQDPDNLRRDRGLSDFDQRHILALNGIWELPFFAGKTPISKILGGWQLAGTLRASSGIPFTVVSGSDFALVGPGRHVGRQRPDVIGDGKLDTSRPHGELVARYFNTGAFVRNALPGKEGQYGNSGRNNLIGPGFSQTDLAVLKRFTLPRERLGRVEFRAEIFNLLNRVNFLNPEPTLISPAFGRLLSAKDGRIVQFALRYDF